MLQDGGDSKMSQHSDVPRDANRSFRQGLQQQRHHQGQTTRHDPRSRQETLQDALGDTVRNSPEHGWMDEDRRIWAQAAYLHERLPLPSQALVEDLPPERVERGRQRMQRWRDSFGVGDSGSALYAAFLEQTGLSEQDVLYLLAEPAEALSRRLNTTPKWFQVFSAAFTRYGRQDADNQQGEQEGWDSAGERDALDQFALDMLGVDKDEQQSAPDATPNLNMDLRLLLTVVEPLLRAAQEQLVASLHDLAEGASSSLDAASASHASALLTLVPADTTAPALTLDMPALLRSLRAPLIEHLLQLMGRTLVLEFRIAQRQGAGLPVGASPAQQFRAFVCHLRTREGARSFFSTYPVLARQVTLQMEQWRAVTVELFTHLRQDWPGLLAQFSPDAHPGPLRSVRANAGDRHRGGHSVQVLQFASGLQLVYKPRSLAVDAHFQRLLSWLNTHGQEPDLRILHVLDRSDHGWMEWVEAGGCTSLAEVERFYRRQGANLAVLYALAGVDVHYDNLIAAGEHPMLVDLETLLHAPTALPGADLHPSEADRLAFEALDASVLRTLLLPYRRPGEDEGEEGVEISGLGGAPGQVLPGRALGLHGGDTGELRFERDRIVLEGGSNRPHLDGAELDVRSFLPAVLEGFTATYRLLLQHREELLAGWPDHNNDGERLDRVRAVPAAPSIPRQDDREAEDIGPLVSFARDTTRVILRPTMHYARLFQVGFHPYLLQDALDQDRILQHLWLATEQRPQLRAVIASEQADLRRGDIPYFTTRVASRDLWASGGEYVRGFFQRSGLDALRERLAHLSEQDLERQQWFIRASFTALATADESPEAGMAPDMASLKPHEARMAAGRATAPANQTPELAPAVSADELLETACGLGDRLCELATHTAGCAGEDNATWLGVEQLDERQWTLTLADLNLYNGLSGIVLALAYLGRVTGGESYSRMARAGYATIRQRLIASEAAERTPERKGDLGAIGYFSGWGGVIATLAHLAAVWQDDEPLHYASTLAKRLTPLIVGDEGLDLIRGCVGCVAGLLSLARVAPTVDVDDALRQCGERLAATAVPMAAGIGWRVSVAGVAGDPLSGFSHGAAGFAWALLRLARHTGEQRYLQLAQDALAYERSLFDPANGNWLDSRPTGRARAASAREAATGGFRVAWCHGAPGIGLARLDTLDVLDDADVRAEILAAVETTAALGLGNANQSLCHGDLGNLELLFRARRCLPHPHLHAQYELAKATVFARGRQLRWRCGTPQYVETPSLMIGLAGMALQLLRMANPEQVPSILTMQPPQNV